MGWEIERRFLVRVAADAWPDAGAGHHLRQGYVRNGEPSVRIRTGEPRGAVLTCKTGKGIRRIEEEAVVSEELAKLLFEAAEDRVIEKIRWRLGDWELDRFLGHLEGLALMEIELETEGQPIPAAPGTVSVLREVTDDKRFVSGRLAQMSDTEKREFVKKAYEEIER